MSLVYQTKYWFAGNDFEKKIYITLKKQNVLYTRHSLNFNNYF